MGRYVRYFFDRFQITKLRSFRLGEVINSAQTPSGRASTIIKIIRKYFMSAQWQHSAVRRKFGYFRVIAIILIVTAALCWGLTHI